MRKITALLVIFVLLIGAVSCGRNEAAKTVSAEKLYEKGDKPIDAYIFFMNPEKEAFKLFKTTVYESDIPENRVKQVLNILLAKPPAGFLPSVPDSTEIKSIYMDANGTCYVNLSESFKTGITGGTTYEYYALYSVVNSIMKNFKDINGVRILIEGSEVETLGGHIKASGILRP